VTGTGALPPPRSTTRRELAFALGRTLFSVVVLLLLYFLLPLDQPFGWGILLTLAVGLLAITVLVALQVRSILRSEHPLLRGVETTALTLTVFLALFAVVYLTLSASVPESFTEPLSRIDALYFVMTVFATVGFGDITPVTDAARVLTTLQMVGDLLIVGLVLRIIVSAVRRSMDRLAAGQRGAPASSSGTSGRGYPSGAALSSSPPGDEAAGNERTPRSSS
jgi:hypothetical protein